MSIPCSSAPNAAIYPFWDDLYVAGDSTVNTELIGSAPSRQFVIEWRNVHFCCASAETFDFEVVLYENGHILMQYRNIDPNGREQGDSATVGIENESGTVALQYSYNEPAISNELAVLYRLPPSGFVQGHVTDANDGLPVAATVRALQDGSQIRAVTADANGFYRMQVPVGPYSLEASATNFETQSSLVTIALDETGLYALFLY